MAVQRLEVPREDNPFAEEFDNEFEQHFEVREVAAGEVSINRWSGGNPVIAKEIAERHAEKRARLLVQQKLNEAAYQAQIAKWDEWMAAEEERLGKRIAFIDHLLELYAHDFHPDEKTVRLPSAELKRRTNRDRIEWTLDDAVRYQQERWPEDLTLKLNKSALKDRLKRQADGSFVDAETGEIVEFVREVPPAEAESFTVVQEVGGDGS